MSIIFTLMLIPQLTQAKTYRVGGDFDYAPFSYIDKTGKAAGLEIEVLNEIARSANLELEIELTPWKTAISNFRDGKTDILAGVLFSEEREKLFDLTIPIHTEYYSIFIRKDLELNDLSNLYDYKLVALSEDVSVEKYLIPMGLYKNYELAGSLPEALSIIELGRADYVIAPNLLGLRTIKLYILIQKYTTY